MKQFTNWLGLCTLLLFYNIGFAQTPGGINYQGVARSQFLVGLNNDSIQLRFTVKEKTALGPVLYTETRGTRTDSFGVFHVVIGATNAINQSGNIKLVKWSDTIKKFLMVEMNILDPNVPGFLNMGTTQLLSVPFSFYSDISDSSRIAARADSSRFSKGSGTHFFSATIPQNNFQSIPNDPGYVFNHIVKFPQVIFTEGNGYDSTTSVFTAPEDGLYYFETHCHVLLRKLGTRIIDTLFGDSYYTIGIFKNNLLLRLVYDREFYHESSSIIVKLSQGDQVALRASAHYKNTSNTELGWNSVDKEDFYNGNTQISIEPTVFAKFSGYKIK